MRGRALASILLVVGCGFPTPPTLPVVDDGFSEPVDNTPPGLEEDPAQPLRLLPGDIVRIDAFSAENTNYTGIVVDGTGKLHVPLAGDVSVGGLTLAEAESRVQEAMRALDRVVRVGLSITHYHGHRATVVGAVRTPGRVQLHPGMRLADLLAEAGGILTTAPPAGPGSDPQMADLTAAQLMRGGEPLPVSLELALAGDPSHNVFVYPGDHLFVPVTRRNTVVVVGAVNSAGVFPYREGIRLTEAIARAGGLGEAGDRTQIRILRGSLQQPRVYEASLRSIMREGETDVVLAPGDVVYVTEEWTAHLGEVLARLGPLLTDPTTIALAILLSQGGM